jgi:hypothetical protein
MSTLHIFKAGERTAMSGAAIVFSETDMTATAAAYDPAVHEAPIVVGHPKADGPAYGWIKSLSASGADLFAEADQVEPAFAEMVKAGRFRKVSAAFYPPNAKGNPTPGVYALRHVGFLGAQPPSVKGLKQVEFAEEDEAVEIEIEFSEFENLSVANMGALGRLARRLREYVLTRDGRDRADEVMPEHEIENIGRIKGAAKAASAPSPQFSEPEQEEPAMTGSPKKTPEEREAEIAAAEQKLADERAAFAETIAASRRGDDEALVAELVKDGRVAPALKADLVAFMEKLDGDEVVAFSEAGEKTPRAFFRGLLAKSAQPLIEFGERAPGNDTPAKLETPAQIEAEAKRRVKAAEADGRTLSFSEAVTQLEDEKGA